MHFQAMESSNGDWDMLFEPYPFFEAYKNYLQIDINAENADDYQKWKGWVESRLRTLTLKVTKQLLHVQIEVLSSVSSVESIPELC